MSHEPVEALFNATLCSTGVVALVLLMRAPTRRAFGSEAVYWLWATVPLALISLALPGLSLGLRPLPLGHPTVSLAMTSITSRVAPLVSVHTGLLHSTTLLDA